MENPAQFYFNESILTPPNPSELSEINPTIPDIIPTKEPDIPNTSPGLRQENFPDTLLEFPTGPKNENSAVDKTNPSISSMEPGLYPTFSDTNNLMDLDLNVFDTNSENMGSHESGDLMAFDKELNFHNNSQLINIPLSGNKQLVMPAFDLDNMNFAPIDSFEQDLQAFEHTDLYDQSNTKYSNLIQVPLRSSLPSPSSLNDMSGLSSDLSPDSDIPSIPRSLEPLPDILLNVPMYKDLFQHYIYIIADLLVPAPSIYPENPFKTILPSMALSTPHLLALLLAFSATHRAKFLHTVVPEEVVSRLMTRAYQGFIQCLENQQKAKSDTTLATAILLSSYDIITSSTERSWKTHMHGARDIVVARDFAQSFLDNQQQNLFSQDIEFESKTNTHSTGDVSRPERVTDIKFSITDNEKELIGPRPLGVLKTDVDENNVSFFLIRWFAYIDVIGSLSSPKATAFLTTNEDMSQLWSLHDWHLERIKKLSFNDIYGSRIAKLNRDSTSSHDASPISTADFDNSTGDSDISKINARHYGIKVDFLLGIDLDVLPVFSKISFFVRQRKRLTKSLNNFISTHLDTKKYNIKNIFDQNLTEEYPPAVSQWLQKWKNSDEDLIKKAYELSIILISLCEAYEVRRQNYVKSVLGVLEKKHRNSVSLSQQESPEQHVTTDTENSSETQNSDAFVYSEKSRQRLESLLKRTESMITDAVQLPAHVQTQSQLSILNTVFCYGAIIHLYRRVMNLSSESKLVQNVVKHSTTLMDTYIPVGLAVECCMSFPLFSIGCEAVDPEIQQNFWLRLQGMERFGIDYVKKARELMELCWSRSEPWTDIVEEMDWDIALI